MQENAARMEAVMQKRAIADGGPMQDFSSLAHAFVYGGAQTGTKTHIKDTSTQQENDSESEYEPDQTEKAAEEHDFDLDEEEVDCTNKVM